MRSLRLAGGAEPGAIQTAGFRLPGAEVVGFKSERHKPPYRSVPPLDARGLPAFN